MDEQWNNLVIKLSELGGDYIDSEKKKHAPNLDPLVVLARLMTAYDAAKNVAFAGYLDEMP